VSEDAAALYVRMRFSAKEADGQAADIKSIPLLRVNRMASPERIAVEIPALTGGTSAALLGVDSVEGAAALFVLDRTVYIQCASPVSVSLDGQGGVLTVKLTPTGAEAPLTGWRVVADVVDQYEYTPLLGSLRDTGMHPMRCADGTTIVLSSKLFAQRSGAEAILKTAVSLCRAAGMASVPRLAYYDGTLPEHGLPAVADDTRAFSDAAGAALLLEDARILAAAPDGSAFVAARANGAPVVLYPDGSHEPLQMDHVPQTVAAAVSGKAGLVALSTESGDVLLCDMGTGVTRLVGEASLPAVTAMAFTGSGKLYLMRGSPRRFWVCDPALPQDDPGFLTEADPFPGEDGVLVGMAASESLLLLSPDGMVYRCDPARGVRTAMAIGSAFAVGADGGKLAVRAGSETAALRIVDLKDKSERFAGFGLTVTGLCVSKDSGAVYYLTQGGKGGASLNRWDTAAESAAVVGTMPDGSLYASDSASSVLLNAQTDGVWKVWRVDVP